MNLIKNKSIMTLLLCVLALTGSVWSATQVVFSDNFEGYTAGVGLPSGVPPIGYAWYDYLSPSNDNVSTTVAKSGTKSLKMVRDLSASSHLMAMSKTTGAMVNGQDLIIQHDVYLPSAVNTTDNYYVNTGASGWLFDGAEIKIMNAGVWIGTGVKPDFGQWNTVYAVLHLVEKASSPLTWGGTYDMYFKKADGSVIVLGKNLLMLDTALGDSIARLHLFAGYASEVYYDDVIMTAGYVSACGDELHPIPVGDLDENCEVNFEDFAIFAGNWMTCTPVACP